MKERNYNFDLLRIAACIMIIAMHAPAPTDSPNAMFLSSVSYFTEPGLCIFFVLSGALLLPVMTDTFTFLKKRLGRIVMPTVVFSLFYLLLGYIEGNDIDWIKSMVSIPFCPQGHGILWFMYTLIGLYLLSPIISKWLINVSKRELEFYLCLWVIAQCYPIIGLFAQVQTNETGILYYFSGYVGYFLLGYYLKTYPEVITIRRLVIPALIAVFAPIMCKLYHVEVNFFVLFYYTSIFVSILTIVMYKIFTLKKFSIIKGSKLERLITKISGLSFGIYLIHIAIMRNWLWKQDWILGINNYYLQWFVIVLLTFTISCAISYVISMLPFGNYIIGYQTKNRIII